MSEKVYIGDGAYAEFDGYGIEVSAMRGHIKHYVYLEPEVFAALMAFRDRVYQAAKQEEL